MRWRREWSFVAQLDHVVTRVGGGPEALAGPGEQGERGLIETLPPTPEDRVEGGTRLGPFPLLAEGEGRFVGVAHREPFRGGVAAVKLVQVGGAPIPTTRTRQSRRVGKESPIKARVVPVISTGTPSCFVAPSTRLARLTVLPSGPYFSRRRLPVLPTRASPVLTPMPSARVVWTLEPQHSLSPGSSPSMACAARQARGVVRLGQWSIPHRENSVADVVDNDTPVLVDPRGEPLQDVAHEEAGLACPQSLGDPGEAADIADKDRHLAILPQEELRVAVELVGQLTGEELLELDVAAGGLGLGTDPGDPRGGCRGQNLDELCVQGLQLGGPVGSRLTLAPNTAPITAPPSGSRTGEATTAVIPVRLTDGFSRPPP